MGFHYDKIFPGGLIGVDIFFVISGYVITVTSLHLQSKNNLLFLKAFYLRRILRLTPAFLFFILCCSIINLLIVSPNQGLQQWNAKVGLSALLGVSNFVIPKVTGDYFSVYSQDLLFLHTWSLSIEFQFYAIAPLLFIFLRNSTRKMYFKIIVLFAVILISLSSDLWLPKVKMLSPWFDYYFSTFGRIWEFAIGALLAVIHTRTSKNVRQSSSLRNKLLYIPLFMLFACSFIESHFFLESRIGFLVPTILTAIFIHLSAISSTHLSSNSLFRRVFSFIGDRSYSIYLWHYPIYISIKTVYTEKLSWWVILMAFSLTLMVSDFSYRFFEIYNFSSDRSFRQGFILLLFSSVLDIKRNCPRLEFASSTSYSAWL
jgi:peptidoglycan/LPS O-acetylase OafA/YrhL